MTTLGDRIRATKERQRSEEAYQMITEKQDNYRTCLGADVALIKAARDTLELNGWNVDDLHTIKDRLLDAVDMVNKLLMLDEIEANLSYIIYGKR